jgi:Icc-related predicted phosphoesterase
LAIKIISDVHGEYAALREQLKPDDTAVLLGDYLNLIDFRTLDGILADVYSREEVARVLELMASGDKELARTQIREAIGGIPEKSERVREKIAASYTEFFESIPCRCYMLYGNTDGPLVMEHLIAGPAELVECGVVEIEGQTFGMVSGAPQGPWNAGLPGEMDSERYDEMVDSLGPVDVLCTHYPPAIPDLTWDTLAKRDEAGSEALLAFIDRYSPGFHYFGHVHSPLEECCLRGETRVVNAGFFRQRKTALVHPADCP